MKKLDATIEWLREVAKAAAKESAAIRSKERIENKGFADAKAYADAKLGKPNESPIGEHPAGSLVAKSATVDGSDQRWRVVYEWEPAS